MEVLSKEKVYNGFFGVNKMKIKNSNGLEVTREQFELHDAVAGLIYNTEKQCFIFVKQFRVGPENIMLEVPAGKMDIEGESPEETLSREVEEEIGYKVDKVEHLYDYYPAPGSSNEKIYLFYAEVSEQISEGGGVETEDIEIVEIPVQEIYTKLKNGFFNDGKSIIAIQHFLMSLVESDSAMNLY
jgi:ADP-ribose pyrophosphatase